MRTIFTTSAFDKMSRDFLRKNPSMMTKWAKTIRMLEKDVFHPTLKTHKLHGNLKELYACRISYDHRIIFSFDEKISLFMVLALTTISINHLLLHLLELPFNYGLSQTLHYIYQKIKIVYGNQCC